MFKKTLLMFSLISLNVVSSANAQAIKDLWIKNNGNCQLTWEQINPKTQSIIHTVNLPDSTIVKLSHAPAKIVANCPGIPPVTDKSASDSIKSALDSMTIYNKTNNCNFTFKSITSKPTQIDLKSDITISGYEDDLTGTLNAMCAGSKE